MRSSRVAVLAASVMVVGGAAGCGPVDAGSAFEEQFEPFLVQLEDDDEIVSYSIHGLNTLPWSGDADIRVTLPEGASDSDIVELTWRITHHEVEDHIDYDLWVTVEAEDADGAPAEATYWLGVNRPAPDEPEAREAIAERLDLARDLAAFGQAPASATLDRYRSELRTHGEPIETAAALCDDGIVDEFDTLRVVTDAAERSPASVELAAADACDAVEDMALLIEQAAAAGDLSTYTASMLGTGSPRLTVKLLTVTGDLDELRAQATRADIALTINAPTDE